MPGVLCVGTNENPSLLTTQGWDVGHGEVGSAGPWSRSVTVPWGFESDQFAISEKEGCKVLKFVWCWFFFLSLATLWGFFLSCSEVGMAMATTSDRDPLRAEGPWRNQPVHREDGEAA